MVQMTRRALLGAGAAAVVGMPFLPWQSTIRGSSNPFESDGSVPDESTAVFDGLPVSVSVKPLADGTDPLQGDDRRLLVSGTLLEDLGLERGQQVLLRKQSDTYAVYTVESAAAGTDPRTVRLGPGGRARLSAPDEFAASIDAPVPHPTASRSVASESGQYVERIRDDGGEELVVVAPHGGRIESFTDQQAVQVFETIDDSTAWIGRGWRSGGGAFRRWHVTSTAIHPAAYPKLREIAGRDFARAVSFHGFGGRGILVGGAAPTSSKRAVVSALAAALGDSVPVRLASGGPYDGDDPENLVNWLPASGRGGIQIEQGYSVRSEHWRTVADTVARTVA